MVLQMADDDLIALLQERGCTDIAYHFTQVDVSADPFDLYTVEDVPLMIEALRDDEDYYGELWKASQWINDPRAAEPLVETLKVEDDEIRDHIINYLIHIGPPAITALEKALTNAPDDEFRSHLQAALIRVEANMKKS